MRAPTREEFADTAERAAIAQNAAATSKWREMIAGVPPEYHKYGWLDLGLLAQEPAGYRLTATGSWLLGTLLRELRF